ncbi:MAG: single-stranded DNA-binding protein [Methylotenera sp.]|nr:MAG: single-stranded DNA-binding protein [Methylotenera sp.]PPD19056.1 MAG: single-stranded DNA-binding protein [Methylotenera sp.]
MIDALISGKLADKPVRRISKDDNPFLTAAVFVSIANGESLRIGVIAFDKTVCAGLYELDKGDSVYLAGELSPKIWQPRDGSAAKISCEFTAHCFLSTYHVSRKRKAMQGLNDGED